MDWTWSTPHSGCSTSTVTLVRRHAKRSGFQRHLRTVRDRNTGRRYAGRREDPVTISGQRTALCRGRSRQSGQEIAADFADIRLRVRPTTRLPRLRAYRHAMDGGAQALSSRSTSAAELCAITRKSSASRPAPPPQNSDCGFCRLMIVQGVITFKSPPYIELRFASASLRIARTLHRIIQECLVKTGHITNLLVSEFRSDTNLSVYEAIARRQVDALAI